MFFKKRQEAQKAARRMKQENLLSRLKVQLAEIEQITDLKKKIDSLRKLDQEISRQLSAAGDGAGVAKKMTITVFWTASALEVAVCVGLMVTTGNPLFSLLPMYTIMLTGFACQGIEEKLQKRNGAQDRTFNDAMDHMEKDVRWALIHANRALSAQEEAARKAATPPAPAAPAFKEAAKETTKGDVKDAPKDLPPPSAPPPSPPAAP